MRPLPPLCPLTQEGTHSIGSVGGSRGSDRSSPMPAYHISILSLPTLPRSPYPPSDPTMLRYECHAAVCSAIPSLSGLRDLTQAEWAERPPTPFLPPLHAIQGCVT